MTATTNRHLLYQEFRKTFPLETLKDMPMEKYTNLNKEDSFCYWLESKTETLGSMWGGSSYKFGIYQYHNKPKETDLQVQSDGKYAWYKKYQKDTAEEAYQIVRKMIVDIATYANEGNYEAIDAIDLGEAYKWKIAFLYSNECLIPFYKHEMLETLASHYGMENPRQRKTSELQRFLLSQKGDRALYEFYDDLVDILNDSPEQVNHIKQEAYPMNNECQKYIELLESTHNLILTGAPGTGKTYLAKEIAKEMGAEVGFVQFHPSYDYTDFVEGLRPTPPDNNGNIGFERKDGVFKQFCTRALQNLLDAKKSTSELSHEQWLRVQYDTLLERIENEEITQLPLKTKDKFATIAGVTDKGNLRFKKSNSDEIDANCVSFDRLIKLSAVFQTKEDLDRISNLSVAIRDVIKGCNATFYWAVLHYLYDNSVKYIVKPDATQVHRKNFVFIIDEINRGEISKIFGELFFSIDPGYRGEEGAVRTQYANMQDEPNIFDDVLKPTDYGHFFIPDNVYIIGTMNDIDRSVESMDFAMRRRFAWQEITAEESMQILDNSAYGEEAKIRMQRLNEAIVKIPGLNKAYQIGAAYFLKLKGDNFDALWKNHIEGVLQEYLRGNRDADEQLKTLKEAYDNKTTVETEHEDDRQ